MVNKNKMRTRLWVGCAASLALFGGIVLAQDKLPGCEKTGTPEKLEGQVVRINPDQGTVTLRGPKGETYEFHASKETLQEYKVGDRIQAKLRPDSNCKPSAS